MSDITNRDLFKPLEDFIKTEEYTDAELLNLIGSFMHTSPHIAAAMLFHARDILTENAEVEITYTEVVCHIYYRTFFSPEHAGRYGTDSMVHDRKALAAFVQYTINPANVTEVPNVFDTAPATPH